jgi:hypothetical protein
LPPVVVLTIEQQFAERLTTVLADNVERALPYQLVVALSDEEEVRPPRELTPIFAGAYDWHSAVHSHWALVRLRRHVAAETRSAIDALLGRRVTAEAVAREVAFLDGRPGFELPYGLAWVLALAAEARAQGVRRPIERLEELARDRLVRWLGRIPAPIRSGEHSQSAFANALAIDWARGAGDREAEAKLIDAAERLHGGDRDAPLHWEPGAHDFLSPTLGAASLLARVRAPDDFARWLDGFAPALGRRAMNPVQAIDRHDGKLVHWDGLNLSRAWMLVEIARALPPGDPRVRVLEDLGANHRRAGLSALDDMSYAGAHWLPSFAVRALTV